MLAIEKYFILFRQKSADALDEIDAGKRVFRGDFLWEAMMAIEPAVAQYAAARRTSTQLQTLVRTAARFKRDAEDTGAAVAAVIDFFTAVAVTTAIKLKRSEHARTWMEKHIRDFKRGYALSFAL